MKLSALSYLSSCVLGLSLGIFTFSAFAGEACNAPAAPSVSPQKPVIQISDTKLPSDALKEAGDNFKARYPKTRVNAFRLTPIPGIFEASVGKEVAYFDKSARFIFTGRILDMEKGQDLTQERLQDIRRIDFDKLPLDLAVKTVKGKGTKRLAVFTDVDCPYSRKLSKTLEQMDDVTIYTFLFPLTSIHPEAAGKSAKVWCAIDSEKALDKALKGESVQTVPQNPLCSAPIDTIIKLAAEHGIGGTPTIINDQGDRTAGALPLDKLQAFVNAGQNTLKPVLADNKDAK